MRGEVGPRNAGLIAPLNRLRRGVKAGLRSLVVDAELVCRIALVCECVSRVVQDNIEDNEQVLLVGGIHEGAEFVVSGGGLVGEARLGADEVVDSVAVIRVGIELKILEHRTQPDSSGSELLDVGELLLHAGEFSALESEEVGIVEWLVRGRRRRVIEAVEHQEVDPAVAPVFGRWKRSGGGSGWVDGLVENRLKIGSKQRGWQNTPPVGIIDEEGSRKGPIGILTRSDLMARTFA